MGQHKQITAAQESALLEATADEISRGFLQGPYSEDEMTVLQEDEKWSLNPRFVFFQGTSGKVRVIDDARRSAVNSAYSSTIKLQLQDIDYAANMVMLALKEAEYTCTLTCCLTDFGFLATFSLVFSKFCRTKS